MKAKLVLLGLFLCLCSIDARHFSEQTEQADEREDQTNTNRRENGHRRKRYHMSYGYDYSPPANPFYPHRREYDRTQDLLPEIFRLLDEVSAYVRRPSPPPPPPPQPIYITYAVPYPSCNCQTPQQPQPQPQPQQPLPQPNITSRFPAMDDSNQNWGLVDEGYDDDGVDYTRPLSFTPIKPKTPMSRPPAALDHGTEHARAPAASAKPLLPEMCEVSSLSCCSGTPEQQRLCFASVGCADTYNNGKGCDHDRLLKIIDEYRQAYAPTH